MTITHHPGEELLLSYASGAADEALSLLVGCHLCLCPQCQHQVREIEAAGGAVLSNIKPAVLDQNTYASVLARLDQTSADIVKRANLASNVPPPLQRYAGEDFEKVAWRFVAPGISHYPLIDRKGIRARLIRATPGAGVAMHTHRGEEWTLVLTGSYSDATGRFRPGDVQTTTPQIEHQPKADPGPVCINLAVTDAPLIFKGVLPKIVGRIFGF